MNGIEAAEFPQRVVVTSLGTAGFPVVRALEGRCPLAGLALAQALYQAPSILWSAVAPEEAERLARGLAAVGLDVEVQAADAEFEAGGPDVDVAIEVLDFSAMTDVLREVVLLLGADGRAARELLCRVPCLLVGGVSTATALAIARRFDPAKVRVLPWSPAKALFDVYVTATTPDLRRRIVENLRAAGHIADDHGPAQGLLMVEGLSFEAADTLWELAGKRPDTLRLVPQALARYELVLGAAPVDEGGWQALAAFLDLPVGRLTAVANRLPLALRGGLDRDHTLAALAQLVPQGVPVHAELQATQAFGLTVSACPKPAESARLIEQLTDRPAAETEAGLRALPLRLAGPFTLPRARWLQHELSALGCRAGLEKR